MRPQLAFAAGLLSAIALFAIPSCATVDRQMAPPEVVATTVDRGLGLAGVEVAWPVDDETLVAALQDDLAAWTFLDDSTGFATPADMQAVLQSQKILVEVAIEKILAGEYEEAQKLELVQNLRRAWDGLSRYYRPSDSAQ